MRGVLVVSLMLMTAGVARAQEAPAPATPDYSSDRLRQIFTTESGDREEHKVKTSLGMVEFRALGVNWHLAFLPFMCALPGSTPGTTRVLPDAFALTGTTFPGTLPQVTRDNDMQREVERIERITRE